MTQKSQTYTFEPFQQASLLQRDTSSFVPTSSTFLPPFDSQRYLWSQVCISALARRTSQILSAVGPTCPLDRQRQEVSRFVLAILSNDFSDVPEYAHLAVPSDEWPIQAAVPYGSFPLKTYLADCDLDMAVFTSGLPSQLVARMLDRLKQLEVMEDIPFHVEQAFAITDSAVPVVKVIVGGVRVDVSVNQPHGPMTALFFELCDRALSTPACPHLFKETVVLAKAWAVNEAHVLGSHHHQLSSYAITTIVLHVFVRYGSITSPLQGFTLFTEFLASFLGHDRTSTTTHALSLSGFVPLRDLDTHDAEAVIAAGDVPGYQRSPIYAIQLQMVRDTPEFASHFAVRSLNIVDPLCPSNNIARSVTALSRARISRAAALTARQLRCVLIPAITGRAASLPATLASFDVVFANSLARAFAHRVRLQCREAQTDGDSAVTGCVYSPRPSSFAFFPFQPLPPAPTYTTVATQTGEAAASKPAEVYDVAFQCTLPQELQGGNCVLSSSLVMRVSNLVSAGVSMAEAMNTVISHSRLLQGGSMATLEVYDPSPPSLFAGDLALLRTGASRTRLG